MIVRSLSGDEAHSHVPALADILVDCVEGGASVSFMAPLSRAKAEAFWRDIAASVANNDRRLLATFDATSIVGTVQLVLRQPENQPHRADIAKMLVATHARRRGIGAKLMRAAEAEARASGKTLLVLDTVTASDAARLYERLGWIIVGEIPGYALWPDGRPCPTTYYYKQLA
jgi:ribosomal protein S18 acetylase RimI-like enzyme